MPAGFCQHQFGNQYRSSGVSLASASHEIQRNVGANVDLGTGCS